MLYKFLQLMSVKAKRNSILRENNCQNETYTTFLFLEIHVHILRSGMYISNLTSNEFINTYRRIQIQSNIQKQIYFF